MSAVFYYLFVVTLVLPQTLEANVDNLYAKYYEDYKDYLKQYKNGVADETVPEKERLITFANNVKMIANHNKKYEQGLTTYKMGLNVMSDVPLETTIKSVQKGEAVNNGDVSKQAEGIIPEQFDWVQKGVIPADQVRNQKDPKFCQSGHVFATLDAIAAKAAMKSKKFVQLSVQQVLDCAKAQGLTSCGPNSASLVAEYVLQNGGVMLEKDYKYKANPGKCMFNKSKTLVKSFEAIGDLDSQNIFGIKTAIAKNGPVPVIFYGTKSFNNYQGGIFQGEDCPDYKKGAYNHALLAVGYGKENGKEYIKFMNSYGSGWGEKGFVRITTDLTGSCGYASSPLFIM